MWIIALKCIFYGSYSLSIVGNPDTLICGNCRECFSELSELLDHKKSYCKLRFTCKCQDVAFAASKSYDSLLFTLWGAGMKGGGAGHGMSAINLWLLNTFCAPWPCGFRRRGGRGLRRCWLRVSNICLAFHLKLSYLCDLAQPRPNLNN